MYWTHTPFVKWTYYPYVPSVYRIQYPKDLPCIGYTILRFHLCFGCTVHMNHLVFWSHYSFCVLKHFPKVPYVVLDTLSIGTIWCTGQMIMSVYWIHYPLLPDLVCWMYTLLRSHLCFGYIILRSLQCI